VEEVNREGLGKSMKKVFIYTQAYNAETTVARTIESILNQTYTDFTYIIRNNASTDKTGEIIDSYAKDDSRIVALHKDVNDIYSFIGNVRECIANTGDGYWALLDADDIYLPEFLEKTVNYAEKNNCDIVACGADYVKEHGEPAGLSYSLPYDFIVEGDGFAKHFKTYYTFMFTYWHKIYSLKTLNKCKFEYIERAYANCDNVFATECFSHADRIGIVKETLHKYYNYPRQSWGNSADPKRIYGMDICCDFTLEYLRKRNALEPENIEMVYGVYINGVKNNLNIFIKSKININEKFKIFRDILNMPHTQIFINKYLNLYSFINDFQIELQKTIDNNFINVPKDDMYNCIVDIYAAIRTEALHLPHWGDKYVFQFLTDVYEKRKSDNKELNIFEINIKTILSGKRELTHLSCAAAVSVKNIIFNVLNNDSYTALEEMIKLLSDKKADNKHYGEYIQLVHNLADATGNIMIKQLFK
jgi:glycosyltransferase involved in cell wall biosynthesis